MQSRLVWVLAGLLWYGLLMLAHRAAVGGPVFPWLYGAGFLVLGVVLLGALARGWRQGSPAQWRPAMLSLGSLAAAADIALLPAGAVAAPLDRWMVAVLGLVGAALLVRLAPSAIRRRWFGLEPPAPGGGA